MYNLQGDVIALVNSAGTKVANYTYDALGKPLSKTGTLAGTLGTLNPFRYRGYVYDDEIDFYYLRSRYYNANRGRFINADNVLDGVNIFRYCGNNPINHHDKTGSKFVRTVDEWNAEIENYEFAEGASYAYVALERIIPITSRNEKNRLKYTRGGQQVATGFDCSGLMNYALQRNHNEGMSTLFRVHSVVVAYIDDIGWENIPKGAILGQLVYQDGNKVTGTDLDLDTGRIAKGSPNPYKIKHGAMFEEYIDGVIKYHHSTRVTKPSGAQIGYNTPKEMKDNGWNVVMWPIEIMPTK